MKVLVCAMAYPPDILGGGEISTRLLAEGLASLGVDVSVLTFTDQDEQQTTINDVPVQRIECPNVYWSFRSRQQPTSRKLRWHWTQAMGRTVPQSICRAVQRVNPTIVHTSTIEDFGVRFWRWAKQAGYTTAHTLRSHCLLHRSANMYDANRDRFLEPDWLSAPKRRGSSHVDGVVGISNDILQRHLQHGFFPHAHAEVIGNPFEGPLDAARPRNDGPIQLGVLGRIEPDKGIEPLLHRLRVCSVQLSWELQIAGSGNADYVDHLHRVATGLPVQFVGWTDSRDFLRQLDLLIIPSRCREGFGRGVVEAYSVGVPVLCLRRGGLPELIRPGTTGWVLDEWSTSELQQAIENCRQLDAAPMLQIADQFRVESIAQQYHDFYRCLIDIRTSAPVMSVANTDVV